MTRDAHHADSRSAIGQLRVLDVRNKVPGMPCDSFCPAGGSSPVASTLAPTAAHHARKRSRSAHAAQLASRALAARATVCAPSTIIRCVAPWPASTSRRAACSMRSLTSSPSEASDSNFKLPAVHGAAGPLFQARGRLHVCVNQTCDSVMHCGVPWHTHTHTPCAWPGRQTDSAARISYGDFVQRPRTHTHGVGIRR